MALNDVDPTEHSGVFNVGTKLTADSEPNGRAFSNLNDESKGDPHLESNYGSFASAE